MKQKSFLIGLCLILCLFSTGCTVFPRCYSKSQVKNYAKGLISEDIKYKKCKKFKNRKVLFFEDEKGREFTVETFSRHNYGVSGVKLPGYHTYICDSYERSIFLQNIDKIEDILNETGYDWTIWTDDLEGDFDILEQAKAGYYFPISIQKSNVTKEELRMIAHAGTQIDELLQYQYHYQYDDEVDLTVERGGGFAELTVCFAEDEDVARRSISLNFSRSDDDRWIEDDIYNYLLSAYNEYQKKAELDKKIKSDVLYYLHMKYNEEFFIPDSCSVTWEDNEGDKVKLYAYSQEDMNASGRIEVRGVKDSHGIMQYTDNYKDKSVY